MDVRLRALSESVGGNDGHDESRRMKDEGERSTSAGWLSVCPRQDIPEEIRASSTSTSTPHPVRCRPHSFRHQHVEHPKLAHHRPRNMSASGGPPERQESPTVPACLAPCEAPEAPHLNLATRSGAWPCEQTQTQSESGYRHARSIILFVCRTPAVRPGRSSIHVLRREYVRCGH
jgi:hypothetical protein